MPASPRKPLTILILGGSSDATTLAHALAGRDDLDVTMSLAGRTTAPAPQPIATRVGGFGGGEGLATFLRARAIDLLVDATHPFAIRMKGNAVMAAGLTGLPLIRVERPAWSPEPGDRWHEVADMAAAAAALGDDPQRAFLTIGRQQLAAFLAAPQHHYLVRTIDPAADTQGLPNVAFIEARPPFDIDAEIALMRAHRIDVLVTKNSGGTAAFEKLAAARALGLPVILVRRPLSDAETVDVDGALKAVDAHCASARRGV
jgi:precorrin-6A/cobalt-precorrin-6A reductase